MIYFPNAKINLGLSISGLRADGFHEINSLFLPVGWCDELEVVVKREGVEGKLNFEMKGREVEGDMNSNLVVRAHALLKRDFRLPEISATLVKKIPSGAGLGGGSSDGSFMLRAINEQCGLKIENGVLEKYATELGSDCPFFIRNLPSRVSGRGEIIEEYKIGVELRNMEVLIVHPVVNVSTAEAFEALELESESPEMDFSDFETISNDFQKPISQKFPEISEVINFIETNNAHFTQMTGSGSAVFGLFKKGETEGLKLVEQAEQKGWSAYFGALL